MVISQFKGANSSHSIAVIKKAIDTGNENATQMTEMMKNIAADPKLDNNIDVSM